MKKKEVQKQNVMSSHRPLLIGVCLVLLCFAVYWPVQHHEFVDLDDDRYVAENRYVKYGLTVDGLRWAFAFKDRTDLLYWQPLTWLSHMLDVQLFGMAPGRHHLHNLVLHGLNVLLLFWVLQRMTGALWRSAFVAGLFALHPLNVESVAWIAERKNVLSTFFWLLTMGAYAAYVRKPVLWRYLPALFTFILGLMTKPMLVTLPLVLLLLDFWPLERSFFTGGAASVKMAGSGDRRTPVIRLLGEKLPFLMLSAMAAWATLQVAGTAEQLPPLGLRMANALTTYLKYVIKAIWPRGLAVLYPYPDHVPAWQAAGALIVLSGLTAVFLKSIKKRPYLAVGWLWFLGTLFPVIGLMQSGIWPEMADRWAYVPLIGLFMMIAWGVPEFFLHRPDRKIWLVSLGTAVLLVLAGAAFLQLRYWENSLTLYGRAFQVTDANAVICNNLGHILAGQGRLDRAIRHYQEALRINPGYVKARTNLGDALARQGRLDEAVRTYREVLRLKPEYAEAHNSLGIAFLNQGRLDEAVDHFQKALQIKPDLTLVYNNLGMAYLKQGRLEEAMEHYRVLLRKEPDNAAAYLNLGNALISAGRLGEAAAHYQEALRIRPGYALAHKNLGIVWMHQGDGEKAMAHLNQALRLTPNDGEIGSLLRQAAGLRQGPP